MSERARSRECLTANQRAWLSDRSGEMLGRVGGLRGEIEDRVQLVGAWGLYAELVGVGSDPLLGVDAASLRTG
jgi:hypothetical protein